MIIQCEQCRTKFKLDDSKVPDKGVKVRCVKCRQVFSVTKEQPEEEPRADFGSMLDSSVASGQDAVEEHDEFMADDHDSTHEFEAIELSPETPAEHSPLIETDTIESQEVQETTFSPDADSAEQILSSVEEEIVFAPAQVEHEETTDEIDFGGFAFNDDVDDTEATTAFDSDLDFGEAPASQTPSAKPEKEEFGGLDFSGDDMFGEVVPPKHEEPAEAISFDFGMDDFAASMGVDDTSPNQKNAFAAAESSSDAPFSLDEIDFGDELTSVGVQHVNPEELKPSQELLFAPLAEAQSKSASAVDSGPFSKGATTQEELPPLSITSRRKQSPFLTAMLSVLGIIIAVAAAYFGYSMFAGDKTNVAHEADRISVRKVDAKYVKNKLTGDLLVISGEAVNEFTKPRAAIQIKGMVYGADGSVISSKNAFCGNPLTSEQLSTMSMEKIEAAMANQFGDSLANMEVAPGKAIPFVIVFAKPSAESKDYGVEPAGSTVATDKQQ